METDYRDTSSSSSSDDESEIVSFFSSEENFSEDENESSSASSTFDKPVETAGQWEASYAYPGSINIMHKLFNREVLMKKTREK